MRALDAQRAPAEFLLALRQVLAAETGDHVDLLPHFPPEWLGQAVAVHDLPLRAGPLSFAVRWHGARPALLWDAPAGIELRASALDPRVARSRAPARRLLAEPPAPLLAMGSGAARGNDDRRPRVVRVSAWTSPPSSMPGSTTRRPTDADVRLAVLRFLTDEVGASIPEIVQAIEEDRLLSMAALRLIRPEGARLDARADRTSAPG